VIEWLTSKAGVLILGVALVLGAGTFFGWEWRTYLADARENARVVAEQRAKIGELEATLAVQAERIKQHNAETDRLENQIVADRGYFATLKRDVEKYKRAAAAAASLQERENLSPLPLAGEGARRAGEGWITALAGMVASESDAKICNDEKEKHETIADPVMPDALVGLRNDAKALLR